MTQDDAVRQAARLNRGDPDRATHRWIARSANGEGTTYWRDVGGPHVG